MYKRIHPYSIIIGLLAGMACMMIFRLPIFALFGGFSAGLIADLFIGRSEGDADDKDDNPS